MLILDDFRGQSSLLVYFVHENYCSACRAFLEQIGTRYEDIRNRDAELVAVFAEPPGRLQNQAALETFTFALLFDPECTIFERYRNLLAPELLSPEDNLLFVLDLYGAPYAVLRNPERAGPDMFREVISWLEYIGLKCPE